MNEKPLIQLIKNIRKNDTFDKNIYKNIQDKYINGECETLVGYLFQANNNQGNNVDIHLIPLDEYGDEDYDSRIFHSIFKFEDYYYDINGKFKDINDIIKTLPYYEEEYMRVEVTEWGISEDNYYPILPADNFKKSIVQTKPISKTP